jgi:hypothetical protein
MTNHTAQATGLRWGPFNTGSFLKTRNGMKMTATNILTEKGMRGEDMYKNILANPSKGGLAENTP